MIKFRQASGGMKVLYIDQSPSYLPLLGSPEEKHFLLTRFLCQAMNEKLAVVFFEIY